MECPPIHPTCTCSILLSPGATLSPILLHRYKDWGCSDGEGTRLWAGQLKNCDFITSTENNFIPFLQSIQTHSGAHLD